MVDRQSLVPDDLPYGERGRLVDARRAAGLPVSAPEGSGPTAQPASPLPSAGSPPIPRSGAALAGFDPLLETAPDQYPGILAPEQSPDPLNRPPANVKEALIRTSTTARSAFIREVGRRLAERQ